MKLKKLIIKYNYKNIYYSADKNNILGSGSFKVSKDVLVYITEQINNLI